MRTGTETVPRWLHDRQTRKYTIFLLAGFACAAGLVVAPRPGLEPGTYGLTESQASQIPI